jgi:hypothetical protein
MQGLTGSASFSDKEKWLQRYARFGLASHGVVYCLMSLLSFMAALGLRNAKTDKSDAFKLIHEQPLGKVMVGAIGIGLLGYVLLRLFQAFRDTRRKGLGGKGILQRISYFFIALGYLSLSMYCFKLVSDLSSDEDTRQIYTGKLLAMPAGSWLVGGVAVGFAIAAVYQAFRGLSKQFMKVVELRRSEFKNTFIRLGMIGYTARGLVFAVIAYLFMKVAINSDPLQAEGTGGAIEFLHRNFGDWLLGITSLGLFAFGIFMFVRAKHEKMNFDMGK